MKPHPRKKKCQRCDLCAGRVVPRTIRTPFKFRGETVYVENVPARVCENCGETYFDAPVYKQLEQIAREREKIQRTVSFPLAQYDLAGAK